MLYHLHAENILNNSFFKYNDCRLCEWVSQWIQTSTVNGFDAIQLLVRHKESSGIKSYEIEKECNAFVIYYLRAYHEGFKSDYNTSADSGFVGHT